MSAATAAKRRVGQEVAVVFRRAVGSDNAVDVVGVSRALTVGLTRFVSVALGRARTAAKSASAPVCRFLHTRRAVSR